MTSHAERVALAAGLGGCLLSLPLASPRAAEQWAGAQPVTVVMVDNRFEPDNLTFHHGKPYLLRLENHGKDMHEFTASAFFHAATVRDKRVLANGGTEVVVQPGKSAQVFLVPRMKGDFALSCADHDWDGMVGKITVD